MIDIVIPIYNAYEDLVNCLKSIKKFTNFELARVLLVNDCSTDIRIKELLEKESNSSFIVINSEINQGFPKTANIGLDYSENDVIILNSDTEVTLNWVEKLQQCAYSDSSIATVTPLSNNASISSVPDMFNPNFIPENLNLDIISQIVEKYSLSLFLDIPIGVGFCMYIKRQVINDIGKFDEISFGIGYGEENDFCHRAGQIGYRHVICDNTYIYHHGGISFDEHSTKPNAIANSRILKNKYPAQEHEVQIFLATNPLQNIQENLRFHIIRNNGKANILQYLHDDFRPDTSNYIGGTQMHVKDIVDKSLDTYNHYVISRENQFLLLTAYIDKDVIKFRFKLPLTYSNYTNTNIHIKEIIQNIILGCSIDVVHIHHVKGHTLDIFYCSKENNIPIITSLHDYYFVCPNFNLLDYTDKYCGGCIDYNYCFKCLHNLYGYNSDVLKKWRKDISEVLSFSEILVAPSKSVIKTFNKVYPSLKNFLLEIPHGSNNLSQINANRSSKLKGNVAFIGGIAKVKGSKLAFDTISISKGNDIHWHVFGLIGDADLENLTQNNFTKHGRYERDEIHSLLIKNKIDLICILSIVPETFCYTLSESLECNIPVIVTNIGALSDRVKEIDCGWIIPVESTGEDVLIKVKEVLNNEVEYNKKVQNIKNCSLRSVSEMVEEYSNLYKKLSSQEKPFFNDNFDATSFYSGLKEEGLYNSQNMNEVYSKLSKLEQEHIAVVNSFTFKGVQLISKVPIPFRKTVKKILKKFYYFFNKH